MSNSLVIFGKTWTNVTGFKVTDTNDNMITFSPPGDNVSIVNITENLHDVSEDVPNTYIAGANETSYNGWTSTGFIPLKPNTYYRVKNTPGNNYNAFYKSDKTSAKSYLNIPYSSSDDSYCALIKTTSDTYFLRMSAASASLVNYEIYEVNVGSVT